MWLLQPGPGCAGSELVIGAVLLGSTTPFVLATLISWCYVVWCSFDSFFAFSFFKKDHIFWIYKASLILMLKAILLHYYCNYYYFCHLALSSPPAWWFKKDEGCIKAEVPMRATSADDGQIQIVHLLFYKLGGRSCIMFLLEFFSNCKICFFSLMVDFHWPGIKGQMKRESQKHLFSMFTLCEERVRV